MKSKKQETPVKNRRLDGYDVPYQKLCRVSFIFSVVYPACFIPCLKGTYVMFNLLRPFRQNILFIDLLVIYTQGRGKAG